MVLRITYRSIFLLGFLLLSTLGKAQLVPNFLGQLVFQFSQKTNPVEVNIIKQDTLIAPGANAQFTLQITNYSIDTLWFKPAAITPDNWTLIQSQNDLFILPQSKRNFTVIASSSSYTPAGLYHFDLGIELSKNNLRFSIQDSVTVASRTQIIAYPLNYPRKISNNSGATSVQFAVENKGNTTEAIEVYLLGNGGQENIELSPGGKHEFVFTIEPPKGMSSGDVQIGCVVNLVSNKQQVTAIRNVEVFPSVIKADYSTNLSKIAVKQGATYMEQGFGPVIRTNTVLRSQFGQRARNQVHSNISNMMVFSNGNFNQNTQFDVGKSWNRGFHTAKVGLGMYNPRTSFFFRLPRNFIGGKLEYDNKTFDTEILALQKIQRTPMDTVDQLLNHYVAKSIGLLKIQNSLTYFSSKGNSHFLNGAKANLKYKNNFKASAGMNHYDAFDLSHVAFEGSFFGAVKGFSIGGDLFQSPENFTPRNSNINMYNGYLNQRIGQHSFGMNASYFDQDNSVNQNSSRYTIGGNAFVQFLPKISLSTNASVYSSENIYAGEIFTADITSYQAIFTRKFSQGNNLVVSGRNQITDMKANGFLNRREAGISYQTSFRSINLNSSYRFEQTLGLLRNSIDLTARYQINSRFSLRSQWGYSLQPSMRIPQFFTARNMLSYRYGKSRFSLMINNAFNQNAPNVLTVQTSGSFDLYIPRKTDLALKNLAGEVIDINGKPVPNVVLSIAGQSVITDKYGRFVVHTINTDSVVVFIDRKSLPFGAQPANGFNQTVYTFDKHSHITINLFKTSRILGKVRVQRISTLQTLRPDFSKFVVIISNGDERIVRNLKADGSLSISGLRPGEWQARLKLKDPTYKAFKIKKSEDRRQLENGEEWNLWLEIEENSQGVKVQRGIGR